MVGTTSCRKVSYFTVRVIKQGWAMASFAAVVDNRKHLTVFHVVLLQSHYLYVTVQVQTNAQYMIHGNTGVQHNNPLISNSVSTVVSLCTPLWLFTLWYFSLYLFSTVFYHYSLVFLYCIPRLYSLISLLRCVSLCNVHYISLLFLYLNLPFILWISLMCSVSVLLISCTVCFFFLYCTLWSHLIELKCYGIEQRHRVELECNKTYWYKTFLTCATPLSDCRFDMKIFLIKQKNKFHPLKNESWTCCSHPS